VAELELTVHCKTLPNRVGFGVMCALFPVWALIVPSLLGYFSAMVIQYPVASTPLLMLMIGLAFIPVFSVFLTAYFEDDRLNLSKDNISFPLFMLLRLRMRRNRSWQELKDAKLLRGPNGKNNKLELHFSGNEKVLLNAQSFSAAEMEQVLLSVELWGNNCKRTPELMDYQRQLQNENSGAGGQQSYTQMWEEELGRRFNATSFVPLEPEHTLRGGQLKVVKQIAFGGLSAIYLAQKNEQEMVVLKEAVVPASSDVETRRKAEEMFNREAALLVKLDHPNVAKVLDHFVDDGRNYLMLEYINGQDLRAHVKQNGPQPESVVIPWAVKIAEMLVYLHKQNPPIIHRDLTPDNLVLRNDGELRLIDFGAANQFVGTATGTLVGKQAYISPEQLRGKADLQSDLYSFGGTLHYLLTGKDPVPLAASHPKTIVPEISDELDQLIAELTAFEKNARVQSAFDAHAKLKALSESSNTLVAGGRA
jgi:tRNA A-37 threonylcarbamoyl transferase component Bud32